MRAPLTQEAFARLLDRLDPDRLRAGERYEQLRRVLIRFFEWRGAPYPEEHADETFDRVSRKLEMDVSIANIGGYCYEVARLVCLEALKRRGQSISLDSPGVPPPVAEQGLLSAMREARFACLEQCLAELPAESRDLILEYYRDTRRARIDRRRALAERFGLQRETLANRAQRLRNRLERCVAACAGRQQVI
jgi:DNA-directed RNA polymerase specialized sigma24 family protein